MGVSVFTESLLSDLQINRNHLSLAYLVGTLGSGLISPGLENYMISTEHGSWLLLPE